MSKKLWALRGVQIRDDNGLGQHIATYVTNRDDGQLLAAAPRMLTLLVDACDVLDLLDRGARTSSTADRIREELAQLCPARYAEATNQCPDCKGFGGAASGGSCKRCKGVGSLGVVS